MNTTLKMVETLKEQEQDFEWYPTTRGMIAAVCNNMRGRHNGGIAVLDVGAGDGRLFPIMDELFQGVKFAPDIVNRFAIEKAQALIQAMPADVCIVGTDFERDTLIDKKVDVIFSNPPYSLFEQLAAKIIKEANAVDVYLVMPERWKNSGQISDAIKKRDARAAVLYSDSFLTADRKARARVDVVHISMRSNSFGYGENKSDVDPFAIWFDEHFPIDQETGKEKEEKQKAKQNAGNLVEGRNQVEVLAELYRADLDNLLANYKAVSGLDATLLKELGIDVKTIREGLKSKIAGLKCKYWKELFDKMESITKRLTKKSRESMLKRLQDHTQVDFTIENAYAVVCWALKNANQYIDKQLLEVYQRMSGPENVRNYKSNSHFEADTWRYCRGEDWWETHHHYALEYRLVLENYHAIMPADPWLRSDYESGLHKDAHDYIGDIFVVARNLGYDVINDAEQREWESNQPEEFLYWNEDGPELFGEVRAFKNGNIHIKAARGFMEALNIEAARLNGWIKSAREAANQLGLPAKVCEQYFGSNLQLTGSKLLPAAS